MSEKLTQVLLPPINGQEIQQHSHHSLSSWSRWLMVFGLLFIFGVAATMFLSKLQHLTIDYSGIPLVVQVLGLRRNPSTINDAIILRYIPPNAQWRQNATTIAGGHGRGEAFNQLNIPGDIYVDDDDQTIFIADIWNHRIVEWKYGGKNGRVLAGGNGEGNRTDQLHFPTAVIIDKETDSFIICDAFNERVMRWSRRSGTTNGEAIIENISCYGMMMDDQGSLYIPDSDQNEVRRYRKGDRQGTVVAGGNGQGDRLNQLNGPRYVFVDRDQTIYVSDENNHRVMKWLMGAKEGSIVAGGRGAGHDLSQFYYTAGVFVDALDTVYVADATNQRVMRWPKGATQGDIIVGGNGEGDQANQLKHPVGLSFDRYNNLYVVDSNNNRIQRFSIK